MGSTARSAWQGAAALLIACSASCGSDGGERADRSVDAAIEGGEPRAQPITMRVLTYNVAGLPEGLSSSMPERFSPLISPLLNDYDLVLLQEDFAYQPQIASMVRLPHRTPADDRGDSLGDGLTSFASAPISAFERVKWSACFGMFDSGSDCLTPKGFSFMRIEVAAGTFVDVYNVHADAGSAPGDLAARASNLEQLAQAIVMRSAGRPLIVAGDFNARYTRASDTMHSLLATAGLRDAWADLTREGMIPAQSEVVACSTEPDDPACERIDKVLYRSEEAVVLRPLRYDVEGARFVDETGTQLSDHRPVAVQFELTLR